MFSFALCLLPLLAAASGELSCEADASFLQLPSLLIAPATSAPWNGSTNRSDVDEPHSFPESIRPRLAVFFGGSVPHIARLRSRGFQEFVSITGVGVAASTVNLLDVLWMLPFLVGAAGLCNGAFFVIVSQLWATLVIVVDVIGGVSVEKPEIWVDFIVGVIAITFALHQLIEERWKGEDEKSEPEDLSRRFGSGTFALLTVIGTFDQILIYAPLLTSHAVTASELEVGIFAASIVTLCVCFLASRIHFVWKALQVIPIWFPAFIVGLMAIIEACYETYEAL